MTTTTAGAIIRDAFRHCGLLAVGQALNGDYLAEGLRRLNLMCDSLGLGPQFAYTKTTTVYALPAGVNSRTIGPGMQINVDRPWRIEASSFIRVDGSDYPLEPVDRDAYNSISLKSMDGPWPRACFFDGGYPTGNLYLWPMGACELHLVTLAAVGGFADTTSTVYLPQGYEDMLGHQLALRLAPAYEVAVPDDTRRTATVLLRNIKRANLEVPQLTGGQFASDDTTSQLFGLP